jgi:hypothetical protein
VADAGAPGRPREAPVGDQHDVAAEPGALDRARHRQHLAHARPALRALVADHQHVALGDAAAGDRREAVLLGVEDLGGAAEREVVVAGDLHHRPGRGEAAAQHRQAALAGDRLGDAADDLAVGLAGALEVLGQGPAGHGEGVAVDQADLQQLAQHHRQPADPVQVGHDEAAARPHVDEVGHSPAGGVEVVEGQLDPGLAGDRQQVQDGVGGPGGGHHHGGGVQEGRPGHDLARPQVPLQQLDHRLAGAPGDLGAALGDRRRRGGAGQGHAERLGRHRHRVGGVHAGARPGGRAGDPLQLGQVLLGHGPGGDRADALVAVLHGHLAAAEVAGQDGAAVDERRRQVQPGAGHQHAGQGLVAAGDGDQAVHPLGVHHQLDRVGDHLAADERRPHALVAHGDGVGDRDGVELQRHRAGQPHPGLGGVGELVEVDVAGGDLVPRRGHADLGPLEVVVGEADRPQHRAGAGAVAAGGDLGRAGAGGGRWHRRPPKGWGDPPGGGRRPPPCR